MSDIKEIWSNFTGPEESEENVPLKILEAQVNAINKNKEVNEVYATIITSSGDNSSIIRNILYLIPIYGNGYNYRYIEFTQQIDAIYPVIVRAFQAGNTDFGTVTREMGEVGIYEVLTKIFSDLRTKIVLTQLKSIGRNVKDWKNGI
jgi:hypothetical protein